MRNPENPTENNPSVEDLSKPDIADAEEDRKQALSEARLDPTRDFLMYLMQQLEKRKKIEGDSEKKKDLDEERKDIEKTLDAAVQGNLSPAIDRVKGAVKSRFQQLRDNPECSFEDMDTEIVDMIGRTMKAVADRKGREDFFEPDELSTFVHYLSAVGPKIGDNETQKKEMDDLTDKVLDLESSVSRSSVFDGPAVGGPGNTTAGGETAEMEKVEEQLDYVSLGELIKKLQSSNEDIDAIIGADLYETIIEYQSKVGNFDRGELSVEEWNKLMRAKEQAKNLIEAWIKEKTKKESSEQGNPPEPAPAEAAEPAKPPNPEAQGLPELTDEQRENIVKQVNLERYTKEWEENEKRRKRETEEIEKQELEKMEQKTLERLVEDRLLTPEERGLFRNTGAFSKLSKLGYEPESISLAGFQSVIEHPLRYFGKVVRGVWREAGHRLFGKEKRGEDVLKILHEDGSEKLMTFSELIAEAEKAGELEAGPVPNPQVEEEEQAPVEGEALPAPEEPTIEELNQGTEADVPPVESGPAEEPISELDKSRKIEDLNKKWILGTEIESAINNNRKIIIDGGETFDCSKEEDKKAAEDWLKNLKGKIRTIAKEISGGGGKLGDLITEEARLEAENVEKVKKMARLWDRAYKIDLALRELREGGESIKGIKHKTKWGTKKYPNTEENRGSLRKEKNKLSKELVKLASQLAGHNVENELKERLLEKTRQKTIPEKEYLKELTLSVQKILEEKLKEYGKDKTGFSEEIVNVGRLDNELLKDGSEIKNKVEIVREYAKKKNITLKELNKLLRGGGHPSPEGARIAERIAKLLEKIPKKGGSRARAEELLKKDARGRDRKDKGGGMGFGQPKKPE